jgi:hypothetical protein
VKLSDTEIAMKQLDRSIEDNNEAYPRNGLKMESSHEYCELIM